MRVALGWHVAAALGVIGDIPAGALELEGGRGHQPMHVCPALVVNRYRLISELLDNFEGFAAAFAFVFVDWQRSSSIAAEAPARDEAR